jgi:hypothetical protein
MRKQKTRKDNGDLDGDTEVVGVIPVGAMVVAGEADGRNGK